MSQAINCSGFSLAEQKHHFELVFSMKLKIGPYLIAAIAMLTIIIWFVVRQGTITFQDYNDATYSLGQLAGLVGFTIFSLTFLLTTRLKFVEKMFGGLDKVYKNHHIMGASAFVLLLFHPLLLVLNLVPANLRFAAIYLLPSNSWPVNFGIIALTSLTILIILTLYISMKYQKWKLSHKLMGIVYFIVFFHVFLLTTDVSRYPLLRGYIILLAFIGGASYIYGSWLRGSIKSTAKYVVDSVREKSKITIVELVPLGRKLNFNPGQFAYLKFINSIVGREQHPFTIAASPANEKLRFAIKSLGDFTSEVSELKKGDEVEIEGPYGEFDPLAVGKEKSQVWVAGGIGVTPFLGIMEYIRKEKGALGPTWFFYCTNDANEAVFLDEINKTGGEVNALKVIPWYSNAKGRISVEGIEKSGAIMDSDFFICGPSAMNETLYEQLIKKGVQKPRIHMENFNLK